MIKSSFGFNDSNNIGSIFFTSMQAVPAFLPSVIKKKEKDGTILYEPDSDLRDTENVPLDQDIHEYFKREVLQHIPDAWIDESKTVKGYEISFTRYFYNYVPPRSIEEITAEIIELEKETEGILNEIVND